MRIAVIGAGAAGLSAGRHAAAAGHDVVLFEQTSQVGGTWVYTDQVGNDEFGLPIHSSMYKGLRTNLPKEIMSYPDYPIPDGPTSYPYSETIQRYLETFADEFNVRKHIRFRHEVIRVRPSLQEGGKWEMIVRDIVINRYKTLHFDAFVTVIVCNGNFSDSKIPPFEGLNIYTGNYLHSKDYRTPDPYAGKRVLVVGLGPSGVDIAIMTAAVADHVVVSYHNPKGFTKLPGHIERKPNIGKFAENTVEFVDGTTQSFDNVIFCTGYNYSFPFLSVDSGIVVEEGCFVKPLFKHCINIEHPTMMLAGLVFGAFPFQVMDIQVRFFLSFLGGRRQLPTRSEMLAMTDFDMKVSWNLFGKKCLMHQIETLQADYFHDLATIGDVTNIKPYVLNIYNACKTYRSANFKNFRMQTFHVVDDDNFTSGFELPKADLSLESINCE